MEILVGRVVADAKTYTLKDERQVVNFSIAVNDSYKPRGGGEVKKLVRYFKCAYWLSAEIARYLTRGALVELSGRIGVDAYKDMQGEARATLTLHVNSIKLHGGPKGQTGRSAAQPAAASTTVDDLPF
jgi:single-strand DNA-binding protein